MRLALESFDGGFRVGGQLVTNLQYADDIVLGTGNEIALGGLRSCELDMKISMKPLKCSISDDQ